MLATQHTQSLSEFRNTADETIARLNQTGEAEILTINGEARAVLLSPAVYEELAREAELNRDVAVMRRSIQQFKEGKRQEVNEFFDELHSKLSAMEAERSPGGAE